MTKLIQGNNTFVSCSQINQPFMQHLSKHASSTVQRFHQLIAQHPYRIWITMPIYFNSFHRLYSKCRRWKWRLWIHYWDKMSLSCLNLFDHCVFANLRKWCEMDDNWTWWHLSWYFWEMFLAVVMNWDKEIRIFWWIFMKLALNFWTSLK